MRVRGDSGFTSLELVVGTVIMLVVFGAALLTQTSSMNLLSSSSTSGFVQEKAADALAAVISELRWAEGASLLITAENGSDRLDLQVPDDFVAGATVWSTTITYRVVASNMDGNGNGVADDWRLVREQGGATHVLSEYVTPGGFSAVRTNQNVALQLQLSKPDKDPDRPLSADVQSSISLRN